MKIEIHSIRSIEKRALHPFAPNTILISIGDIDAEPPRLDNKPDHILRLTFDDFTLEIAKMEFGLPESITSSDKRLLARFSTSCPERLISLMEMCRKSKTAVVGIDCEGIHMDS